MLDSRHSGSRITRLVRAFRERVLRRVEREVYVVFARRSIQAVDPIIAIRSNEQEVLELERSLLKAWPGLEVTWTDCFVKGAPRDYEGMVHLVTQSDAHSPVVVGAFARTEDARRLQNKMQDPDPDSLFKDYVKIRSLPIGWTDPGRPWMEEAED